MTESAMDRGMDQSNGISRKLHMANEKAWLSLGAIAEMTDDIDQTILAYEKVLTHNRMNTHALMAIATCYEKAEDFHKAGEYFHHLVNINNVSGDAWAHLGYCFLMTNDLQNSYTAYQHALYHVRNPKDPNLWYGIGLLYERYGSFEHAEEAYDAVLKMNTPIEVVQEVKLRLGVVAKQKGQYEVALEQLRQLLGEVGRPELIGDIWQQIGHVYELSNDLRHAKSSYLKVLDYNPKSARTYQQLGWLCMKSPNESSLAIEYLKKSVAVDANDIKGWYLLGRSYMAINNCEEAYHSYKQAVNCDASDPNVWCSLGVLFYQLNQYLDALDAYSRAINLNPNICEVWYNVGTLYDTCNQTNDARDAYQKAAELGADSTFIRERLEALQAKEAGSPNTAPPSGPSEPPTVAPMGPPPGQGNSQYAGGAPAPLMPSPATSGTIQISRSMNTTMQTSAPMSQVNPQSHMGNPSMNRSAMMSGQQGSQSMQLRGGLSHQQAHSGPMSSSHMRGMASMPQRGGMPPGRQLDGQTHESYRDMGDKKMPPSRLAGLDPKTMGHGAVRDRLPMPPMSDNRGSHPHGYQQHGHAPHAFQQGHPQSHQQMHSQGHSQIHHQGPPCHSSHPPSGHR